MRHETPPPVSPRGATPESHAERIASPSRERIVERFRGERLSQPRHERTRGIRCPRGGHGRDDRRSPRTGAKGTTTRPSPRRVVARGGTRRRRRDATLRHSWASTPKNRPKNPSVSDAKTPKMDSTDRSCWKSSRRRRPAKRHPDPPFESSYGDSSSTPNAPARENTQARRAFFSRSLDARRPFLSTGRRRRSFSRSRFSDAARGTRRRFA